jgi:hypothetical protein
MRATLSMSSRAAILPLLRPASCSRATLTCASRPPLVPSR